MKPWICFSLLISITFLAGIAHGQDRKLELCEYRNQWGSTNLWIVSLSRLTNAPRWRAGTEPPLSLGDSAKIGLKWVSDGKDNDDAKIMCITLKALAANNK